MKALLINTDRFGENTFCIPKSDSIATVVLAGADQAVTVPTGASKVLFSSTDDFYMNIGAVAVVPSASAIVPADASELNPTSRSVAPGEEIHVIGVAGTVTMSFYA